jgi:argininosuccinate lyase
MSSRSTDAWIASPEQEQFDAALAEYDCWATKAHVIMLRSVGILADDDARAALEALTRIEDGWRAGGFRYEPGLGAQLTLEKLVIDQVGPAIGNQIHTGRSRNDQVLTAQKLYVRDRILELSVDVVALVESLLARAKDTVDAIMPGYTHMQPARPTTVAQWCAAYADMYLRDLARIRDAYVRHNTSPLGAAESYGTSWPLDREHTCRLLAFDAVDEIPMEAVSSRGESDADFLSAMSFLALHLSKTAQDLLLFTTFEYGYAELSNEAAQRMGRLTGSSIMPQKRNPDVLELVRAQASEVHANLFHCLELLKGLPMGYNRDSRDTKGPIIRGIRGTQESVRQTASVIAGLRWDEARMLDAVNSNYSMATDLAEYLAQNHRVPFRIMYKIVGRAVDAAVQRGIRVCDIDPADLRAQAESEGYEMPVTAEELAEATDPVRAVQRRRIVGGPARERMAEWQSDRTQRIAALSDWATGEIARIVDARARVDELAGQPAAGG